MTTCTHCDAPIERCTRPHTCCGWVHSDGWHSSEAMVGWHLAEPETDGAS